MTNFAQPSDKLPSLQDKLTPHFTFGEAIASSTADRLGDPNLPSAQELQNILYTAQKMEEVREILGDFPIIVTSWFRNEVVNRAVGGAVRSQHRFGEAVDFKSSHYSSPYDVCVRLANEAKQLQFDQLILEPSWVHISFTRRYNPRQEILTLVGPGRYAQGLVKK